MTRKKGCGTKIHKTFFYDILIFCPQFLSENLVITSPKLLDGLTSNFQKLFIRVPTLAFLLFVRLSYFLLNCWLDLIEI